MAGALGVQRQELLTKRKIFQDEVPTRTQGADNPADEVPEPREHGRNLIQRSGNKTGPKSFILRVHDILMRDSAARAAPGLMSGTMTNSRTVTSQSSTRYSSTSRIVLGGLKFHC
jgi:hypothetical protein